MIHLAFLCLLAGCSSSNTQAPDDISDSQRSQEKADITADAHKPDAQATDSQEDENDDAQSRGDVIVDKLPYSLSGGFNELSNAYWDDPNLIVIQGDPENFEYPDHTVGLFADLNNDGETEVIIAPNSGCEGANSQVFRLGEGGALIFEENLTLWLNQNLKHGAPAAALDINGDGFLDLVSSCSSNALHMGEAGGGFLPSKPLPVPGAAEGTFHYGSSIGLFDLDQDGLLDLMIGDRRCPTDEKPEAFNLHPVLNLGNNTYVSRADLVEGQLPAGDPYTVMAAPSLPGGETLLMMIGRPCTKADPPTGFFGLDHWNEMGHPVFQSIDPTPLESLYKSFTTVSFGPLPQISPMAASVTDVDGDGRLDTTISVSPGNSSFGYLFFRGTEELPWEDQTEESGMHTPIGALGNYMKPWGTALVDLDGDGRPDHVAAHGDDAFSFTNEEEAIGPQWTTFSWNQGGFHYVDITEMMGPIKEGNWYSLTVGDLEENGTPDFIVGGQGHLPAVYHNVLSTPYGRLAIRLKGSTSNHLGIGATLQVFDENGESGRTYLMGQFASPRVISQPIVYLGIGIAEEAHRLRITWPSGLQQDVHHLAVDQVHTIAEPELITLGCPDRHLPADGASTCSITVIPRHLDGTYNPGAEVTISIAFGTGSIAEPAIQTDTGWTGTLKASSQPGSVVIQIEVDGIPVKVRPRVWWD